ncbi:MAG: transcriptional regulator [Bacteroidetes bacterium]|nr:transcriptional regulator [Bacteroidota bacterium]
MMVRIVIEVKRRLILKINNMDSALNSACFSQIDVRKDNHKEIKTGDSSTILFVLSGKVLVSCVECNHKMFLSDGMLFLPPGTKFNLLAIETSVAVKCEMTKNSISQINQWLALSSENNDEYEKKCLTLPIKYSLKCFLEFFHQSYSLSGFNFSELNEWKQNGLILVLKNSYSMNELAAFFSPILGKNMDFKEFVYANYKSVKNLQEFADLAKCSLSVFCREFKKNFGESAYQWMLERKSQFVLQDIISTSIPFQELADRYQFSSQAHFTKFCKQRYNQTPKDLRSNSKTFTSSLLH